jgi:dienelactone hydrolase
MRKSIVRSATAALVVLILALSSRSSAAAPALAQPVSVVFPSKTAGLRLSGILYRPASSPAPAIVILSGTSGREGFQNWEIPWGQRLQGAGYVALIVDSFTPRHLAFAQHWRLSRQTRGQDALDAAAFLRNARFVRADAIGAIGRSGGGSGLLSAVVERIGDTRRVPFKMAAVDYGYCQLAYGDWRGGTTPVRAAGAVYRTSIPVLITIGTLDSHAPVAACVALAANARKAGVNVMLRTYAGAEHAFDTLYGDGTPAQQAGVVNTIADFIAEYLGPAPNGERVHMNADSFVSRLNPNGGSIVVSMRPGHGPATVSGSAVLLQRATGVAVALHLSESSSRAVAEIRQGSCAQLYPEPAYRLGDVVNGTGSGLVANVRLSYLMNGHFAIVVVPSTGSSALLSCSDIPRNT